jgi:hypothetical protein
MQNITSVEEVFRDLLKSGKAYLEPLVVEVSEKAGIPQGESQLLFTYTLIPVVSTLVLIVMVQGIFSLLFRRRTKREELCCVTKFVQQRKAQSSISIPSSMPVASSGGSSSGAVEHFLRDIQHQLVQIQRELQNLKQEREVIDNELIETSTQILQTIGAQLNGMEEDYEIQETPVVVKPQPSRIVISERRPPDSPQEVVHVPKAVGLPKQQPVANTVASPASRPAQVNPPQPIQQNAQRPVVQISRDPSPASKPAVTPIQKDPSPVAKPVYKAPRDPSPASRPTVAQVPAQPPVIRAPVQLPVPQQRTPRARSPVSSEPKSPTGMPQPVPQIPPVNDAPTKAAPKMSALAAARLKREQEMADAKVGTPSSAPVGATNPFVKPKPGPFGAPVGQ